MGPLPDGNRPKSFFLHIRLGSHSGRCIPLRTDLFRAHRWRHVRDPAAGHANRQRLDGKTGVSLPLPTAARRSRGPITSFASSFEPRSITPYSRAASVEFRSARPLSVDTVPTKRFLRPHLSLERSFEDLKRVIRASSLRNASVLRTPASMSAARAPCRQCAIFTN